MLNKVPPQATEEEKAVLGAILLERDAFEAIGDTLRSEMFYSDRHQTIFTAFSDMQRYSQSIDLITAVSYLTDKGILEKCGGSHYISVLTNSVVSSAHILKHAHRIVEMFIKREQIRIGGELITKGYDLLSDAFETQETSERQLHDIVQSLENKDARRVDGVAVEVFREIDSLRNREHYLIGITSGYKSVDRVTMGWQKSDFNIIAARPAVGKTAFTLSLAVNAALAKAPSAFFSLEMSAEQLVKRVLASMAKMYLQTIKGARLDDCQMEHLYKNGVQPIAGMPLYIDDTASLTVTQFKAKLRRLVRRYGVKIAFVDYLQLLKSTISKNATRQQQIGDISRELKITAKELNIPIIALSQLSRGVEKDKRSPVLSDLREAGDIEQDADSVIFLYGHSENDIKSDMNIADEVFLKYAKHRNGALANIKFCYNKDYQSFKDEGDYSEKEGNANIRDEENPF